MVARAAMFSETVAAAAAAAAASTLSTPADWLCDWLLLHLPHQQLKSSMLRNSHRRGSKFIGCFLTSRHLSLELVVLSHQLKQSWA
jgi:hypothetical protein